MADEFPFSGTQLIDPSQPTDGTLGTALDDAERETRRAINFVWDRATVRHFRHVDLVPLTRELDVRGDKILEMDISELPHTLVQITGGYEGQIIYLMVAESTEEVPSKAITLHHNPQYIALRDSQDFLMKPGDVVILRNSGGDIDLGTAGSWVEWGREVAGTLYGMLSPDGTRFSVEVTNQGALRARGL